MLPHLHMHWEIGVCPIPLPLADAAGVFKLTGADFLGQVFMIMESSHAGADCRGVVSNSTECRSLHTTAKRCQRMCLRGRTINPGFVQAGAMIPPNSMVLSTDSVSVGRVVAAGRLSAHIVYCAGDFDRPSDTQNGGVPTFELPHKLMGLSPVGSQASANEGVSPCSTCGFALALRELLEAGDERLLAVLGLCRAILGCQHNYTWLPSISPTIMILSQSRVPVCVLHYTPCSCVCSAGTVLAGAGVDFDASLFNLLGPDYVARLMHKTGGRGGGEVRASGRAGSILLLRMSYLMRS